MGKSDFLLKALPKFSVGQNLILNIIKLLEMSTSFFFQHLIMKLNSGHVMPLLFSFTLWPMHFHAILIRSHTAWNLHGSHFLSDTGFMEQYGWKICKDTCLSHRCLLICIQQEGTLEAFKETSHPRHPSSSTPSPWFQVPNQNKTGGWKRVQSWRRHFPQFHQQWRGIESEPFPLPLWGLCNQQNGLAQSAANGINI